MVKPGLRMAAAVEEEAVADVEEGIEEEEEEGADEEGIASVWE